jgi:hypothetical protein
MFFVGDRPQAREQKIRNYLNDDPMIAILLAAANFEWTVGRCILFFSTSPNTDIRQRLARCHGLDSYKELWKDELIEADPTIPSLVKVVRQWAEFKEAFVLRHKLIRYGEKRNRNSCGQVKKG